MRLVPTVSVLALRPLLAFLAEKNIENRVLLERLGVQIDANDDDARVPMHRLVHLWSHAEAILQDPDVGLHAAEHATFDTFRALSSLAATSSTLGAGLAQVERYIKFITGLSSYTLTREGDSAVLALTAHRWIPHMRHAAELLLAVPHIYCGRASTWPWSLTDVTFSYARPASSKEHARIFGCPVAFDAKRDALRFSAALLDSPSRFRDDDVALAMSETSERIIRRSEQPDVVAAARLCVWERLRAGDVSIAGAAKAMGMSERTLQRELSAHKTSHRILLDEVRSAFGEQLLKSGTRLHEVALLLGFAEQTAFQRAFKRWFGTSPARWRREE